MARRAAFIDSLKDKGTPLLIVELGDFMEPDPYEGSIVNPFLLDRMEAEGTAAVMPGVLEVTHWGRFEELMAGRALPVVQSNVTRATEDGRRPIGRRSLITYVGDVRVGLIGVMGRKEFAQIDSAAERGFAIEDPLAVIDELAPELAPEVDLVAVMACMDDRDVARMAREVEDVDLMLGGYESIASDRPFLVEDVIVSRCGMRGQQLNTTRLIVSPQGEIVDWFGYNYSLTIAFRSDARVDSLVDEVRRDAQLAKMRKMRREVRRRPPAEAATEIGQREPVEPMRFVGAATCGSCHGRQYAHWQSTAHARAFELYEAHRSEGATVSRYVTGYGQPLGWRADRRDVDLRGVQCEACHGPASRHARGPQAQPVTEAVCRSCHDPEDDPTWNMAQAWMRIRH